MRNGLTNALLTAGIGVDLAVAGLSNAVFPFVDKNFRNNSKPQFGELIHSQTSGDASRLKMGYFKTSVNGCGCFAAYNAALLKGKRVKPADIIYYYEKHGGIVLDGLLGVNPLVIRNYMRRLGFSAILHSLPKDADKLAAASEVSILAYAHKRGMHYVAVERAGEAFRVYNEFSGGTAYSEYPSLNKWLKSTADYLFAVSIIQVF